MHSNINHYNQIIIDIINIQVYYYIVIETVIIYLINYLNVCLMTTTK